MITTAQYNEMLTRQMSKGRNTIVGDDPKIDREASLHSQIIADLKQRRLYFVHSRTDKRTTNQVGTTDFIIAMKGARTLWLEIKRKGQKLTKEQNITRHILLVLGHEYGIIYSFQEYQAAINAIEPPSKPPEKRE